MGKSYSVNGYINATLRRSVKTLLVEGITDKAAIHRLAAERFPAAHGKVVIDHAGLLEDVEVAGLGNKAKIHHVRAVVESMSETTPKLKTVFASLVDREWDDLSFVGPRLTSTWAPPVQNPPSFVTHGHSIESYYLDVDCVIGYLKFSFAEHISFDVIDAVENRFKSMLNLATVFSLCAKESSCLTRCTGLFHPDYVRYEDGHYCLTSGFVTACLRRNIEAPTELFERVNAAVAAHNEISSKWAPAKWIAHGHIGSEILWSCVADTVASFSVNSTVVASIALGHQVERMRFSFDWLCKADAGKRTPLDDTVEWLHN